MTDKQSFPNLAGVATADLVEKIGTGKFSASYINWSRTMQLLREGAPGWLPEMVPAPDGGILHQAPVGGYLLIRFVNGDQRTPALPQAIMDTRNAAIPLERITARDITDTHRRGICMAAALTFGLAYELWAKLPLESGYQPEQPAAPTHSPRAGIGDDLPQDWKDFLQALANDVAADVGAGDVPAALERIRKEELDDTQYTYMSNFLDAKTRAALKGKK